MIALLMIMRYVLRQHMVERRFPKQEQARETLLFDLSLSRFLSGMMRL